MYTCKVNTESTKRDDLTKAEYLEFDIVNANDKTKIKVADQEIEKITEAFKRNFKVFIKDHETGSLSSDLYGGQTFTFSCLQEIDGDTKNCNEKMDEFLSEALYLKMNYIKPPRRKNAVSISKTYNLLRTANRKKTKDISTQSFKVANVGQDSRKLRQEWKITFL